MTGVRFLHTLRDLEDDFADSIRPFAIEASRAVKATATEGQRAARRSARRTAGAHGRHYFKAITVGRLTPLRYEYGPESAKKQGDMSFERGSRNQKPHLDIARSRTRLAKVLENRLDGVIDRTLKL